MQPKSKIALSLGFLRKTSQLSLASFRLIKDDYLAMNNIYYDKCQDNLVNYGRVGFLVSL